MDNWVIPVTTSHNGSRTDDTELTKDASLRIHRLPNLAGESSDGLSRLDVIYTASKLTSCHTYPDILRGIRTNHDHFLVDKWHDVDWILCLAIYTE